MHTTKLGLNNSCVIFYSAPDDKVFRQLSQDYADRHPTMKKADVCGGGFKDGITNGAYWYGLYYCYEIIN